ncbi:MAG: hypothetical protein Q3990_00460 [Desulfovibrionaceae bacterium]|nr:hypothetical protein [Desulfovibrionaceae bacterium]
MGMFFFNGYMNTATLEENFSRSLRIDGQVAVANLEVMTRDKREPDTVQARLDFSGVSDTQMLLWAAITKITGIHRAIRKCSFRFLKKLFRQGPVFCPASTAETLFIDPNDGKWDTKRLTKEDYFILCLSSIEGQVAVIDIVVLDLYDKVQLSSQISLDFSDVSDTQMLLWAARTKMIDLQNVLYRCDEHDKQFLADLVKQGKPVCRHASEAGNPFDDVAKKQQHVMTTAKDMSAEERAALIKLLQEMDNK